MDRNCCVGNGQIQHNRECALHMNSQTSFIWQWFTWKPHLSAPMLWIPITKLCKFSSLMYPTPGLSDTDFSNTSSIPCYESTSQSCLQPTLILSNTSLSDTFYEEQTWLEEWESTALCIVTCRVYPHTYIHGSLWVGWGGQGARACRLDNTEGTDIHTNKHIVVSHCAQIGIYACV